MQSEATAEAVLYPSEPIYTTEADAVVQDAYAVEAEARRVARDAGGAAQFVPPIPWQQWQAQQNLLRTSNDLDTTLARLGTLYPAPDAALLDLQKQAAALNAAIQSYVQTHPPVVASATATASDSTPSV
jgi:hypothetical protein